MTELERTQPRREVASPDSQASVEVRAAEYGISVEDMLFVLDYIVDLNPGTAYINQVNPEESPVKAFREGRRILSRADISKAVTSEINKIGNSLGVTREVVLARAWTEAIDITSKASDRIRALDLVARMIGAAEPDPNSGKSVGPVLQIVVNDPRSVMAKRKDPETGKVETLEAEIKDDGSVEIRSE